MVEKSCKLSELWGLKVSQKLISGSFWTFGSHFSHCASFPKIYTLDDLFQLEQSWGEGGSMHRQADNGQTHRRVRTWEHAAARRLKMCGPLPRATCRHGCFLILCTFSAYMYVSWNWLQFSLSLFVCPHNDLSLWVSPRLRYIVPSVCLHQCHHTPSCLQFCPSANISGRLVWLSDRQLTCADLYQQKDRIQRTFCASFFWLFPFSLSWIWKSLLRMIPSDNCSTQWAWCFRNLLLSLCRRREKKCQTKQLVHFCEFCSPEFFPSVVGNFPKLWTLPGVDGHSLILQFIV